ncbi:GNAT family N-acetyltransferase [Pelagibius litoralis]|uniref:GNAT family N-acetyltransferase n=1 Tax=Pelagibius litoralis TaxID=374515 RepID=A0A967C8C4_9PROT|nr:GNAT family N-acetyltransferase [Pelagibius litoralis]NIA68302.1 GNAT family N-acetyltransferase [Pelagibius litoralis]
MTWLIERKRIETERLVLRPFEEADAAVVQTDVANWDIARMTTRIPHPYPAGAAAEWIASHGAAEKRHGEAIFCIAHEDQAVGAISLRRNDPAAVGPDTAEIGYWLTPRVWGRGLATESASALVAHAFDHPQVSGLTSGYFSDNPASGRVLAKCGFQPVDDEETWSEARQKFVTSKRLVLPRAAWQAEMGEAS